MKLFYLFIHVPGNKLERLRFASDFSGLYYKHVTSINDASSSVNK